MPLYDFRCPSCFEESTTSRSVEVNTTDKTCPSCGESMDRRFSSPAFHRFTEHYSPATGQFVSSPQDFREQLKRASAEATEKTGVYHNFVPTELTRKEGPGTEEQAKKHRDLGTPGFERKKTFFTP
jgi:putative FmdB family regulatory protein